MRSKTTPTLFVVLLAAIAARADDLGDPAPKLEVSKWVKGDPVALEEGRGKHVYVIEFWSTRCPQCRGSIPHLTRLQQKFQDQGVIFVGVTDEQQDADRVEWFVKKMGDRMDFRVAIDNGQKTTDAYMAAFGEEMIPCAFVVDKQGKVVWKGRSVGRLEETIEKILDGTFDVSLYRDTREANELLEEYLRLIKRGGGRGALRRADEIGERIYRLGKQSARLMNELAWTILDDKGVQLRDLRLAMKAAQAAYEACDGKDPAIVDTYARAFYETGNLKMALKYQEIAVELARNEPRYYNDLVAALEKYRREAAEKPDK